LRHSTPFRAAHTVELGQLFEFVANLVNGLANNGIFCLLIVTASVLGECESCPVSRYAVTHLHPLKVTLMSRTYRDGWTEIFGDRDSNIRSASDDEEFNYVEPPVIAAEEIDWTNTRALSIRQPWAELIMLGEKDTENRGRATNVRGRIAIYASLSEQDLEGAEDYGLSLDKLPRGVIIGTVELFDCDGGKWKLREPKRLSTPLKPTAHPAAARVVLPVRS
jgi:hypothetical protein